MAGTSFFTFTAGTPARASEVDSDFDWLQRDIVPMLNGNLTDLAYDLGTTTAAWRRLYVSQINPTTTEAPLLVGTTTAANASSTVVEFAGTGTVLLPRITTTQRNLLTGVNGMMIYNSSANVFQLYENGAWRNMGIRIEAGTVNKVAVAGTTTGVFVTILSLATAGRLDSIGLTGQAIDQAVMRIAVNSVTSTIDQTLMTTTGRSIFRDFGFTTSIYAITNGASSIGALDIHFTTLDVQQAGTVSAASITSYIAYQLLA